ncbi:MAG: alpha-amylase, partial [Clostridia bacterium]|nr:alpha-amylase [Clostridia bacterium]
MMIYQIFVRNYSAEGTFKAVEQDLDRIKALGTDIIYFLPIHPIGQKNRKGTLGSPYAIKDYRKVNPEYGSQEDFKSLTNAIHNKGMKCMIDVVYNHTSPDSLLSK